MIKMKIMTKKAGGLILLAKIKLALFLSICLFFAFPNFGNSALVNDYEIEKLLNELINPIIKISNVEIKKPYFYLVLNPIPNGFVDKSNKVFITTGLITEINKPEALVGVLAHEIAHLKAGHLKKRDEQIESSKNLFNVVNIISLSTSILSNNPDFFVASNTTSAQILNQKNAEFNKDQEREADVIAFKILEEANITTNEYKELFKKLLNNMEKYGVDETKLNIYTHPYKIERIQAIESFQKNSNSNDIYLSEDIHQRYEFIRAKIDGYTLSLEKNILKYDKSLSENKFYALSISYAKEGYIKKSMDNINKLINLYPENPYFYETKGDILLSFGYSEEAYKFFEKSLSLDNNNDYARIHVIEYLLNKIDNKQDAIQIFDKILSFKLDIWKNNRILNVQAKICEILDREDYFYQTLAFIEINKGNNELGIKYLEYVINITEDENTKILAKKTIKELVIDE